MVNTRFKGIAALVTLAFISYRELPSIRELTGGILILGSAIQMNRLEG